MREQHVQAVLLLLLLPGLGAYVTTVRGIVGCSILLIPAAVAPG
jgi:hypothetical protein